MNGVLWCGMVKCGLVWCGVLCCGVVWCGVVWCGVVWGGVDFFFFIFHLSSFFVCSEKDEKMKKMKR